MALYSFIERTCSMAVVLLLVMLLFMGSRSTTLFKWIPEKTKEFILNCAAHVFLAMTLLLCVLVLCS